MDRGDLPNVILYKDSVWYDLEYCAILHDWLNKCSASNLFKYCTTANKLLIQYCTMVNELLIKNSVSNDLAYNATVDDLLIKNSVSNVTE